MTCVLAGELGRGLTEFVELGRVVEGRLA
jgi:hypothetical protein